VFGITLAILAGLIFAWVFKVVLLSPRKEVAAAPPPMRQLTVAAVNIRDKQRISQAEVKVITLPESEYRKRIKEVLDRYGKQEKEILIGAQPVFRIAKVPLRADEPILESQLFPHQFTQALGERVAPQYRAVTLSLPVNDCGGGLIRPDDTVDLLCTLTNDNPMLSGGNTGTITLAKNLKVLARNNTTEIADVTPADLGPHRNYTVQVSPRIAALISVAQRVGATFALVLITRPPEAVLETAISSESKAPSAPPLTKEDLVNEASTKDLADLFGIMPPPPPAPMWNLERWTGTSPAGSYTFPYPNLSPIFNGEKNGEKKGENGGKSVIPASDKKPGAKAPAVNRPVAIASSSGSSAALSHGNSGFRPVNATPAGGCVNCGKR